MLEQIMYADSEPAQTTTARKRAYKQPEPATSTSLSNKDEDCLVVKVLLSATLFVAHIIAFFSPEQERELLYKEIEQLRNK